MHRLQYRGAGVRDILGWVCMGVQGVVGFQGMGG